MLPLRSASPTPAQSREHRVPMTLSHDQIRRQCCSWQQAVAEASCPLCTRLQHLLSSARSRVGGPCPHPSLAEEDPRLRGTRPLTSQHREVSTLVRGHAAPNLPSPPHQARCGSHIPPPQLDQPVATSSATRGLVGGRASSDIKGGGIPTAAISAASGRRVTSVTSVGSARNSRRGYFWRPR